jgi:hypothetical protein
VGQQGVGKHPVKSGAGLWSRELLVLAHLSYQAFMMLLFADPHKGQLDEFWWAHHLVSPAGASKHCYKYPVSVSWLMEDNVHFLRKA